MEAAELDAFSEWYNDNDLDYRTPRLDSSSPSPTNQSQPQRLALPLLQLDDWTPNLPYNEAVPTCIRYSIEWKLLLNKGRLKKLTNDTEQNLTLAPGAFWDTTLKSKLEQLLKKKTPRTKSYEPEETTIIVSVTDRTERDLSKRFDEQDIEWGVIEDQLRAWSHLLHVGKRLRIEISFICKEVSRPASMTTRQSTSTGGATAVQFAERDQLLASQEASGQSRVWSNVYNLMRCTGPPCDGRYCWRDANRKHFPLDTSILTKLVQYAEEGNQLDTHQDVPPRILDLIYAKERESAERKRKRKTSDSEGERLIKIINVLPGPYTQALIEGYLGSSSETSDVAQTKRSDDLRIPKPRDKAPGAYCQWHCA
ncbi:hypothetical protein B0J13DRAFT_197512, partial [Dactylonectria estremocensis]